MEVTKEYIENLDRERIIHARKSTEEQRFIAGAELFDMAAEICISGIKHQHPGMSDADALSELKRRLAWQRQREWHEIDRWRRADD